MRLDDADLSQWSTEALGQHIGYLPQEVALLDTSIDENISRLSDQLDARPIVAAAREAGIHEMIVRIPEGYKTQLGPLGTSLSGGQRQLIGLARAIYGNPFLVVLDEPNSSLDGEGENALTATIRRIRERGGIVIVIAHRPSALGGGQHGRRGAERQDDRVRAQGRHYRWAAHSGIKWRGAPDVQRACSTMIIDVHGTKKADNTDPLQPYAFSSEDARTRTPMIFSAIDWCGGCLCAKPVYFRQGGSPSRQQGEPQDNQAGPEAEDSLVTAEAPPAEPAAAAEDAPPTGDNSVGMPRFPAFGTQYYDSVFAAISVPDAPLQVRPVVLWPANDWYGGFSYLPPVTQSPGRIIKLPPPQAATTSKPPVAGKGPQDPTDDEDDDDPNRAPRVTGPVFLRDIASCAMLVIYLEHLLANASDPDGDALAVLNLTASSGRITLEEGRWHYAPEPYYLGPVTLSYKISDGALTIDQIARFSVTTPAPILGTTGDDILTGGTCGDEIYGDDGHDIIDGRDGDDIIYGGNGNDHILGGRGNDIIFGGAGNDVIFGEAGNDQIYGGSGRDRLFGGEGDDTIFGEDGDDLIYGDAGNDYLSGGTGNDTIYGGTGNDVIEGDEGDDILYGEDGNDIIRGGAGDDHIDGGEGNDVLFDGAGRDRVLGGAGDDYVVVAIDGDDDHFDGGEGRDTIDFSDASDGIVIDLVSGLATSIEIGNDTITGFENIIGGAGDDHFIVGHDPVTMTGGEGANTFEFPDMPPQNEGPILYEIVDFKKGDVIKMSKYKIFDKVFDELEDEFERIYGREIDDDEVKIRYRHEEFGQEDRTVIEADFNNDNIFETSITLHGHHVLVVMDAS